MMKGKRRDIKEKKRMKGRKEGQIKKRKNLKKSDNYQKWLINLSKYELVIAQLSISS